MLRFAPVGPWRSLAMILVAAALAAPCAAENAADKAEGEEGFVSLFNGKNLDGWQGSTQGYEVVDGVMICKKQGGGNLYTVKEYQDFAFRFEFKLEPGANNGVGLRTPMQGDAAYVGMESQILDDDAEVYKSLAPYQYHGSIYGVIAAKRGALKKVGEWNSQEIALNGRDVKIVLNGKTIVEGNLDEASTPKTVDGRDHPGLKNKKGYISFCGHGARIEFRNLRIKELK